MSIRKFFIDGGYLFGAEACSRLFAFSVTFVLARQMGLGSLALLALAQALIAYALVAGDAGLGTAAVGRIAQGHGTPKVIQDTARAQIFFAIVATVIMFPIVAAQTTLLLAVSVSSLPVIAAASTTYVLQGRLDARWTAISRVVGNCVVGVGGITMSALALPLWIIALAYPAGAAVSMLIVNYRSGASLRLVFGRVDFHHLRSEARPYLSLALFTIILHAYSSCLIIFSQNLDGGRHFVEVALSTRILLIMVIPAQILGSLLLPRYAKAFLDNHSVTWARHAIAAGLAGCVLAGMAFATAGFFIPLLFGANALGSVASVQVIAFQVPLSLVSTVLVSVLLARKRYGTVGFVYLLALCAQIIACFLLANAPTPEFICSLLIGEVLFVGLLVTVLRLRRT